MEKSFFRWQFLKCSLSSEVANHILDYGKMDISKLTDYSLKACFTNLEKFNVTVIGKIVERDDIKSRKDYLNIVEYYENLLQKNKLRIGVS